VDKGWSIGRSHFVHRVPTGSHGLAGRFVLRATCGAGWRKRRSAQAWAVLETIVIEKINKILIKRTFLEIPR
jgi:hypothetical protein